ncbi:T9SS type A sorting domain-containing protein [Winogradskyella sp. DF17]|uniref:T9SS type A sorting domain-containing protein n=1 Tax=Winogradskyella pelagia TaxID=2819984 RepID=A0ABS3SYW9_9FLAO|nr:alpha-amylase family glycosyl hydrolase [Winogradskyella sp. DF17]MBO3115647.1 T9SS type A sorting domain-containing protein [Winogradskyella sp. DF17]
MKKITLLILLLTSYLGFSQLTISPNPFEITDQITITIDISADTGCNGLVNPSKVYMHSGAGDDTNAFGFSVIGNWGQDDGVGEMVNIFGTTWAITITPSTYYGLTTTQQENVTQLGFVFRNANGTQEMKNNATCDDFYAAVGAFQHTLTNPTEPVTFLNAGQNLSIASTTTLPADFNLKANGTSISTNSNTQSFSFNATVNTTTLYELEATAGGETIVRSFQAVIPPTVVNQSIPAGIREGINYNSNDATRATVALRAPNKDYIYVAGSFNGYTFNNSYVMRRDTAENDLYWLELTGLTPGQIETYQYWAVDENPVANSPNLVKTADPFSTLVLSPFDDGGIPSNSYPNLPAYPVGQEREVTVLQTGQTPYNWVVDNFTKPKKEDLVVYEVLVRDFDADRNYQNLIDRFDYFKNLNINAIQLMPVMEFDGNETWGYNTAYHMALDKFYGTSDKFKEFVDLCHQNGIAVILDIALNHATGRNPLVRLWMDDPDNDGWGGPSSANPYFNTVPQHDYNVFNDFNHQSTLTQEYTERVIEHWITEYKIDGFRWDLTKGFTQNCGPGSSPGCTDQYQPDRVQLLKEYADHSWNLDPTHYVIFEHLGQDGEEKEWADYRLGDSDVSKGIMMWGKMTSEYTDFVQGFSSNISRATHQSRGFNAPRLMMYPESHDEERVMYETVEFGNNVNPSHNPRNLNIALQRMASMGAVSLTLPGPKMIWHFAALGMDDSIFTCSNGTVNNPNCKLDTKPQPQWVENWLGDTDRKALYDAWARLIDLKINEPVFEGDYVLEGATQSVRAFIFDNTLPNGTLKNVVILANFRTIDQNIIPDFPFTGTWYDLMDNSPVNITSTSSPILIPAGEFRIYGNEEAAALSIAEQELTTFTIYPNPAQTSFKTNLNVSNVEIYDITGKLVKAFKGDFTRNDTFDISDINTGIYIVKIDNNNNQSLTTKLVKL